MLCCLAECWVLELSDWPECQHSQHHVTDTKTESNDLLRFPTLGLSQPARSEEGVIRPPRGILLTTLPSSHRSLLYAWLAIFFAVREIICGFVLNADPSHFGRVLWYFSSAKLDPSNLPPRFSVRRLELRRV